MAGAATLLWPFVGFLMVAALASWWQARAAKRELQQSGGGSTDHPAAFSERQEEIRRFKKSREHRAAIFAVLALAALLYLKSSG